MSMQHCSENPNKETIRKAIECCAEFSCGECPYLKYEDKIYKLKCIRRLMVDARDYLWEDETDGE